MIRIHYKDAHAPKSNQPLVPSVHGVILNDGGAILLHRREDHPYWALPGGKMDLKESLLSCLIREMREEVGVEVEEEKLLGVYSSSDYLLSVGEAVFQPFLIVFLCHIKSGRIQKTTESVDYLWVTKEKIRKTPLFPLVLEFTECAWGLRKTPFFGNGK